jgi:hypothetical protein
MSSRYVRDVLAAGVDNPGLIARWRQEPQLLRRFGVDPSLVDLDAVWKFAGLTVKVRHNALRDELPMTFRLMAVARLEIDLFAAYASDCAARGARFASSTEGRALDLVAFLSGWLDRDHAAHALLWDMIRHERALGKLSRSAPAVGSSPNLWRAASPPVAPSSSTVPRVRGELVLHEMVSDPRAVARALDEGEHALAAVPRTPGYVGYWRTEGRPEITILQLDELGFHTLALVDGVRTIGALHRGLGGVGRAPAAFLRLLAELEGLGIVALRHPT